MNREASTPAGAVSAKAHWTAWDAYQKAKRILSLRVEREKTMASFVELGNLHLSMENFDEAEQAFRRALEREHPVLIDAYEGLGVACVRKGTFKDAIDHFRRAFDRNPSNFDLWSNLAEAYLKADQPDRAEVEYRALLARAPGHIDALVGLGQVYVTMGDVAQQAGRSADAEDMFSRAVEQFTKAARPSDPASVSGELDARARGAMQYACGYALAKRFELQPMVKQDTDLLERARNDFRLIPPDHENYHKAQRAIRKLDERLQPPLRLAEQWGPRLVFGVVFFVFLAAQIAFFSGYAIRHDSWRITDAGVDKMRLEGLPEEAAKKLRALGAERFADRNDVAAQAGKALGDLASKLEPVVLKHVSSVSVSSRLIEAPSYLTLTFGSLVFLVAALYLQQISKLKFGAIELEKSSGDLIRTSVSLGITK